MNDSDEYTFRLLITPTKGAEPPGLEVRAAYHTPQKRATAHDQKSFHSPADHDGRAHKAIIKKLCRNISANHQAHGTITSQGCDMCRDSGQAGRRAHTPAHIAFLG